MIGKPGGRHISNQSCTNLNFILCFSASEELNQTILQACKYRYHSATAKRIREESRKRGREETDVADHCKPKKRTKLKEKYLVTKRKFFSSATSEELAMEIKVESLNDEVHRIIQAQVR